MKRYVLAYSGGLDTSVILKWLQVHHQAQVITVTADLGQQKELQGIRGKAEAGGALEVFVDDLRQEFVDDYIWPSLKAGALYQGTYPLATALGRPLIAKRLVEVARQFDADAVVHGCTAKGNDQVRLEVGVAALAPDLDCLAPLRQWELKSREEEIAWAREHDIPIQATTASPYSIDENLWGMAIEAGALEDPWAAPPDNVWHLTAAPEQAPGKPEEVVITFTAGVPTALNGESMGGVELIQTLNRMAAAHGVGRIDMVEDRLVGIKSREVYEAPAAVTLHTAREALEQITLDRQTRRAKTELGQRLAALVYDGLWLTPLRRSIQAFMDQACQPVSGQVRMSLFKGLATAVGRQSPNSLYDARLATYGVGDLFQHGAADGFIELFGLPARLCSEVAAAGQSTATGRSAAAEKSEPQPRQVSS